MLLKIDLEEEKIFKDVFKLAKDLRKKILIKLLF